MGGSSSSSSSSSSSKDAQDLFRALWSAYASTPTNLKIIDLYVIYAVFTALIQVVYMAFVGSFPFNSFLSGVLSCVGTAVLAAQHGTYKPATYIGINLVLVFLIIVILLHFGPVCLRIQVNKDNKEFKDLAPERAFADFVLCNLVLHLVIMNFLG
ncbi:dolichyl-diphosphooligosaccharide--protein glycosyltransferase subunit DAD1-like isoform X1 [Glycine soja]|uniref:Dolichyl-diphosphooligosaccharide--protein glycosyltransferase subunit DAD1 n=1 Tax=Glycine soja TaxID=3848 RepID=A0A445J3W9_GLYSO|nr:dolichyl-diphosphooligosaccharide--protein glycosyltransferase subunit DAD1-like isoform X1 [Glycine soja]RZB93076.1 Dolichyl-diphosphooligosaccharide--protein glycosyltransferase subunit DAD1 isoform B [Glycine soja]RZB93077.1 Dolichyl-diphosphooligosaccharide--protein glycosyltransferase subunit DAD1 isoform C [Glycine soja]